MPISSQGKWPTTTVKQQAGNRQTGASNKIKANKTLVKQPIKHISNPSSASSTAGAQMLGPPQPISLNGQTLCSANSSASSLASEITSNQNATAQLRQTLAGKPQTGPMSIKRQVNLKHIKSIVATLLALDLMITLLVHQFSTQDQLVFSLFRVSLRVRLSAINLVLSGIWFIILLAAILFDLYPLLLLSCLVDSSSFFVLLAFSVNHFTRRIDYNVVQLQSLLALLFAIVLLHVYLLALASLMVYLALAVKRRNNARHWSK